MAMGNLVAYLTELRCARAIGNKAVGDLAIIIIVASKEPSPLDLTDIQSAALRVEAFFDRELRHLQVLKPKSPNLSTMAMDGDERSRRSGRIEMTSQAIFVALMLPSIKSRCAVTVGYLGHRRQLLELQSGT